MSKSFSLDASPTFKAKVNIAVPGSDKAFALEFTFKHMSKPDFIKFMTPENAKGKTEVELIKEVACGWALGDAFTDENIQKLLDNYYTSGGAIIDAYVAELYKAREKN